METLIRIFGEGKELTVLQMSCRAVIVFLAALLMLRVTGQRTFGHKSAVDQVVMIMLGAVLSRAVTGSSPFLPVMSASIVIVLFHRFLGWLSLRSEKIGDLVKGKRVVLYKDGIYLKENMDRCMISEKDMLESIRLETNNDTIEKVKEMAMERCGAVSVVEK